LHNVSEFMRQECAAERRLGCVLAGIKGNVGTRGIREGVDGARRFGGLVAGVDADVAEVVAEAGLEESARGGVKGVPGGAENVGDDVRNMRWGCGSAGAAVDCRLSLFLLALVTHLAVVGTGAWSRSREAGMRAHDGVGNVVGCAFVRVVGIADGEFGLNHTRAQKFLDCLIPCLLL
jgi:hypothetical protein